MAAGRFRHRVTLQRGTESRTASGGFTVTWTDLMRRWAHVEDSTGRELYRAQQVNPSTSAVITLREQAEGLTTEDRVVYGTRTFNIAAVLGASAFTPRQGQVLHCTEGDA